MRIWIDLVNSPHVPFFLPIISRLEEQGHTLLITYRDFAQTAKLVENYGLQAVLVDGHGGKSKVGKIKNLLSRTIQLIKFVKSQDIDLALSHNSYFQLIAAKFLKIPSVTSMDFEGQPANHIAFRLASLVCVPEVFPPSALKKFGAKNIATYRGLKEDICLSEFIKEPDYIEVVKSSFKLNDNDLLNPVVLVRPPPSLALYHNDNEDLFELFLSKISKQQVTVLISPRTKEQKKHIAMKYPNFHFSDVTLNGLQLISCMDMVVSGGGSMNREAACLNVPALSLFSGDAIAVDSLLQEQGRLTLINKKQQIDELTFSKVNAVTSTNNQHALDDYFRHVSAYLM